MPIWCKVCFHRKKKNGSPARLRSEFFAFKERGFSRLNYRAVIIYVGNQGFEPWLRESKSPVLPLHQLPIKQDRRESNPLFQIDNLMLLNHYTTTLLCLASYQAFLFLSTFFFSEARRLALEIFLIQSLCQLFLHEVEKYNPCQCFSGNCPSLKYNVKLLFSFPCSQGGIRTHNLLKGQRS